MLAGCMSQSDIQRDYVSQQNECRTVAAQRIEGVPDSDTQAAAGVRFSECMNRAGWRVAMPKPSGGQVAQGPVPNPPSGAPSTNPSAAAASAPVAQMPPPYNPATSIGRSMLSLPPAQPHPELAATPPAMVYPPSGAPSTNPSAMPSRVGTSPAPAQYMPARPPQVLSAPYGTGAGRQF
jgi:hypothetical protein